MIKEGGKHSLRIVCLLSKIKSARDNGSKSIKTRVCLASLLSS